VGSASSVLVLAARDLRDDFAVRVEQIHEGAQVLSNGLEQFRPLLAAGAVDIVQTASGWGVTHFLRVAALAHAYDLPVSPIGTTPLNLVHAATSVPNHIASELQDLRPPVGVTVDLHVEDGAFLLGDSAGLGIRIDEEAITSAYRRAAPAPDGPHVRPERAGRQLLAVTNRGAAHQPHPVDVR